MKRSEINAIMRDADAFIRERGFHLPRFAYWLPEEWEARGRDVREIVDRRLGWDITDFGQSDFKKVGLFLFTVRNGSVRELKEGRGKLYAEKIMVVDVGQVTPTHFHWLKTEDIINRGGGRLAVRVFNATESGGLADAPVSVATDGVQRMVEAGETILLDPGDSITLEPYCYHTFWGEDSRVLVGEVSTVNDDATDNRFLEPVGRFPTIEEDEPPAYLLVGDYQRYRTGEGNR